MKRIFISACILLASFIVFAQTTTFFEGKIVYQNTFKSKNPQMKDEQWTAMFGSTQEFYAKGNNYKSVSNGSLFLWQIYSAKENKIYSKMSNSPSVYWNDAAVNTDTILKTELKKATTVILGYTCDELTLTCKSGIQKYYYNSKLGVDPKLFSLHKYGNFAYYLAKSKAWPLKSYIETDQFTITSTATEVKPMVVDVNIFKLPAGVKIEKSPY
ncbi:hypothetical protein [Cytophaga aurantiaca]|uniref:hypothetical protein n=1 Tax=Cytophaga aurantiaca TaxID=29530 RepID=UPI001B7FCC55|nr:hypothetical protein [Cytophaga aurantiaca]